MTLSDRDIDRIAHRVVDLLGSECPAGGTVQMIDAATAAERLGVSRASVYELADELGARRIGNGPKPRLRFDASAVDAYGRRVEEATPRPFRRPQRATTTSPVPLLRIKEAA